MTGAEETADLLAETIEFAIVARDKADKTMRKFTDSNRLDGDVLREINFAMATCRVHLAEAARLAADLP